MSITIGIAACGGGGGGGGGSAGAAGSGAPSASSQAPVITAQPERQSATAGANVTLSVSATGPDLSYQWQRDGKDIPGATGAGYTLNDVQPADAASEFTVQVKNGHGTVYSRGAGVSVPVPTGLALLAGQTGGPGNLDGQDARFYISSAMAVSPSGMLLMVDAPGARGRLRSIDPATGVTTTLMTYAEGTVPHAMVFDAAGNRYDMGEWAVYKTTPAGARMRLAGGTAAQERMVDDVGTDARFSSLVDMAIDGAGNLYVIDAHTRIRKINPAGQVTTLAGIRQGARGVDGSRDTAVFAKATRLAADQAGNVYVIDSGNYPQPMLLRKVTPEGTVTTVPLKDGDGAGPILHLGDGAGALTFDPNGNLYVTGQYKNAAGSDFTCRIRKIAADGTVITLAGGDGTGYADGKGDAARFCAGGRYMERLVSDKAGNLYLHDAGNYTVRRITPAGDVTTVAGRSGQLVPNSNAIDDGNGRAATFGIAPHYQSDLPRTYGTGRYALAVDPQGNLYGADGDRMRKITPTGTVSSVSGRGRYLGSLAYGGSTLVVSNGVISRFDANGVMHLVAGRSGMPGEGMVDGSRDNAVFQQPYDLIMDGLGNVYLQDGARGDRRTVQRKISPDGFVTTLPAAPAGASPIAVWHADKDGFVWAATMDGAVLKIDRSGKRTTVRNATQQQPTAITRDAAGNLYLATAESAKPIDERGTWCVVRKIAPDGTETIVAGTEGSLGVRFGGRGSLGVVHALAAGPDGILYLMSENALLTLKP